MSWKPEVYVQGTWSQNSLVFATKEEAYRSAAELSSRWFLVQDYRAVESDKPVTHKLLPNGEVLNVEDPQNEYLLT